MIHIVSRERVFQSLFFQKKNTKKRMFTQTKEVPPELEQGRGKVMSQEANKLQRPFMPNSFYSRDPISKMSKTVAGIK